MRVIGQCDVEAASACDTERANIFLNGEQVECCSNCLEVVAKEGEVVGGELYYDR